MDSNDLIKIENDRKIYDLKKELSKIKEDVEQVVLFGVERSDYEKKERDV